ncbi:lon protease homolog 1, mitochondrial [Selaginella moellendorffii]|uniref:lon protease homolog 1, mitochondrial n=1 Tax=Selaginella moellendorffii TaxID=88036 RepID=UPI000D1CC0C5|nr:lon protease homolog 1, mitochondrial [Selaginella moellendorffii]|eukprot:XP_024524109.1 lon protease homolog 1, mitochondrial [Selaginella moellendorffii]
MLAAIVSSALRDSPSLRRLSIRPATWPAGARAPAWGSMLARSFDGTRHTFCSGSGAGKGGSDGSSKNGSNSSSKESSEADSASSIEEAAIPDKVVSSKSSEGSSGGKGEGGSKTEGKGEKEGGGGGGGGGRRKPSLFQRILKGSGGDKSNKASAEATEATVVKEAKEAKEGKDGKDGKDLKEKEDQEGAEESAQSGAIVPAGPRPENFPKVLALPLTRRPLFPGFYAPIHIKDPKLADSLVELRARGTPYVGAFLLKDAKESVVVESENARETSGAAGEKSEEKTGEKSGEEVKDSDLKGEALYKRLHEYGTFAQVLNVIRSVNSDGPAQVFLMGHRRLRLTGMLSDDPLTVSVEHLKDKSYDETSDVIKATFMEVVASLRDLMRYNPLYKETIQVFVQNMGNSHINAARLADFGSALTTADEPLLQEVLEQLDVEKRLNLALVLLKKELELAKLQATIAKNVEEKISGDQRRFFLMEQLKAIKKELGIEADDKTALTVKFKERLEPHRKQCPEHVLQVIDEELSKLQGLESSSSEFNVTRNYLDWLTALPWGQYSKENFDVRQAQTVLDEDHYGLSDVKERILEFIAVGKLKGTAVGKIICLSGPPGVGKTSIGKSIAKALNRKFFRFSVGGLSDVAEIKGHRRTYVGAMPGKMVQCLKSTGTANPLVLIDEIDKLGRGHAGDPASALLELLDPEQNANFLDHYLDVPIDLSKVLFVCTANLVENIPAPLLDRMEVIRLVGYITDEKMHIARDYLERQARENCGIKKEQVELSDSAMHSLIETYCREAGVRNLQKHIDKIYRKIALKLVRRELDTPKEEEMKQNNLVTVAETKSNAENDGAIKLVEDDSNSIEEAELKETPVLNEKLEILADELLPDATSEKEDMAIKLTDSAVQEGETLEAETMLPSEKEKVDIAQKLPLEKPPCSEPEEKLTGVKASTTSETDNKVPDESASSETKEKEEAEKKVAEEQIKINDTNLHEFVGSPVFVSDRFYDKTPIGVVMGLAWTAMGGSTLYVETSVIEEGEGKGGLQLTGQLGDVMKESASIAHTFARKYLREIDPQNQFFTNSKLHLHVPAGATPKDGPSAGCTMITSMLSLALSKPVNDDVAMTGEVTLTGRVLAIGGVKEKTVASRRSAVKTIIFPKANKRDYDELLPHVKEGLDVHFVDKYEEIFQIAFVASGIKSQVDMFSASLKKEAASEV